MNNNTIESIEWHKDQLAKLLSDEIGFYKVESELDSILEKAKMKKKVKVTRGGKTFYREQEVGRKDDNKEQKVGQKEETKKELSLSEKSALDNKLHNKLIDEGEYGQSYESKMRKGSILTFMVRSKPYKPFADIDLKTRDISYIIDRCAKFAREEGWSNGEINNFKLDMISGDKNHRAKIISREFKV